MIIDGKEWRLVPVEAVREMLDAAHFGPNCAEEGLSASDEKFWIDVWNAMLNSAPQPPEVVVTEEARVRVIRDMISGLPSVRYNRGDVAIEVTYKMCVCKECDAAMGRGEGG